MSNSSDTPRKVSIVGSTGSIGKQSIDVVLAASGQFEVVALAAYRSVDLLVAQAAQLRPELVAVADVEAARQIKGRLPKGTELVSGPDALSCAANIGDTVINAVVGFAGLPVTVEALRSGRRLALANKESLIAGAPVVQAARATPGAEIVPVDSEHCAVHQCIASNPQRLTRLPSDTATDGSSEGSGEIGPLAGPGIGAPRPSSGIARIVLTASGGPFRGRTVDSLAGVTLADALAHPTWQMGPKITVDSSTLMNKGLEVIEAHELFGVSYDQIDVVVHPQSIIHSMVELCDGATIAQLSWPDMRLPIGYALSYPERLDLAYGSLDWAKVGRLDFEKPDLETFSCLSLAYEAGRSGNSAPAWLNAANEVAVEAFLAGQIPWLEIAKVVAAVLDGHVETKLVEVGDVLEADAAARRMAREVLGQLVERL